MCAPPKKKTNSSCVGEEGESESHNPSRSARGGEGLQTASVGRKGGEKKSISGACFQWGGKGVSGALDAVIFEEERRSGSALTGKDAFQRTDRKGIRQEGRSMQKGGPVSITKAKNPLEAGSSPIQKRGRPSFI